MQGDALYEFYERFLLPQFGIKGKEIVWSHSTTLGPDEDAHYFRIENKAYVLVFEDIGGLAIERAYIEESVGLKGKRFEYVLPVSATEHTPSWILKFPTPYQYCHNITGAFTLIEIHE